MKWNGIVVRAAGLNLKEPVTDPGVWRDVDRKAAYPYPLYLGDSSTRDDVTMVTERRWIFYSPYDGHCIDFLEYGGKVYLYDPSFGTRAFQQHLYISAEWLHDRGGPREFQEVLP